MKYKDFPNEIAEHTVASVNAIAVLGDNLKVFIQARDRDNIIYFANELLDEAYNLVSGLEKLKDQVR